MKNRRKLSSRYFKGRFIQETDYFYVFESKNGYCECFLKIDFVIKDYLIDEVLAKVG